jgi:hypothetical protein
MPYPNDVRITASQPSQMSLNSLKSLQKQSTLQRQHLNPFNNHEQRSRPLVSP